MSLYRHIRFFLFPCWGALLLFLAFLYMGVSDTAEAQQLRLERIPDSATHVQDVPVETLRSRARSNRIGANAIGLLVLGNLVFTFARYLPALLARRMGTRHKARLLSIESAPSSWSGSSRSIVRWQITGSEKTGRTSQIGIDDAWLKMQRARPRRSMTLYRAPLTGKVWWEGELPYIKP